MKRLFITIQVDVAENAEGLEFLSQAEEEAQDLLEEMEESFLSNPVVKVSITDL